MDNIEKVEKVVTTERIHRDFALHRRASTRICKDCGKFYVLSDNDAMHFIVKYGSMPLRCEVCRKRIRDANPLEKPIESE